MKKFLLGLALLLTTSIAGAQTFSDNFASGTLDPSKWTVSTYSCLSAGLAACQYTADVIDLSQGMLRIAVNETQTQAGIESTGGEIVSKQLFGYGTFQFVMRMSTTSPTPYGPGGTVTGAVSSAFMYLTNSVTEIDQEFLGDDNRLHVTTWHGLSSNQTQTCGNPLLADYFETYTLVWAPGSVKVYIGPYLVSEENENVPTAPAHIILQHRGTNSNNWGGLATLGTPRYAYYTSVSYTP